MQMQLQTNSPAAPTPETFCGVPAPQPALPSVLTPQVELDQPQGLLGLGLSPGLTCGAEM